jgi:hypothetical protein
MAAVNTIRAVLIDAMKLAVFALAIYAISTVALSIERASSPTSKDLCDRVEIGMTVDQVDDATRAFEGRQLLRYDGVMVISSGGQRDNPACRVAIDPQTHRAISKTMGPLQQGDWPTL